MPIPNCAYICKCQDGNQYYHTFYDLLGNQIDRKEVDRDTYLMYMGAEYYAKYVDPATKGKVRPTRMFVGHCIKRGLVKIYYDLHDNCICTYRLNEKPDNVYSEQGLCLQGDFIDHAYVQEHQIPVKYNYNYVDRALIAAYLNSEYILYGAALIGGVIIGKYIGYV